MAPNYFVADLPKYATLRKNPSIINKGSIHCVFKAYSIMCTVAWALECHFSKRDSAYSATFARAVMLDLILCSLPAETRTAMLSVLL